MIRSKVLFLCSGNSCRTQMAEAFLRELAGDRFDAISAGGEAAQLNPEAVEAMSELGIDISGQKTKKVSQFLGERFAYVISLCNRQKEPSYPILSGAIWRISGTWKIRPAQPSSAQRRGGSATNSASASSNLSATTNRRKAWKSKRS